MQGNTIGLIVGFTVLLLLIPFGFKKNKIGLVVLMTYSFRFGFVLFNRFFYELINSPDARRFEKISYQWSQLHGSDFLEVFEPNTSLTFSWFGALVYKVFGRSPFLLEICVVVGGTLCVYFTIKIAQLLVQDDVAVKVGWFAALFPTSIMFSAVYLREAPIILFSLVGLYYLVKWSRSGSEFYFFLGVLGLVFSMNFHSAYIIGIMAAVFMLFRTTTYSEASQFAPSWMMAAFASVGAILYIVSIGGLEMSKIGNISVLFETGQLAEITGATLDSASRGEALYLQWLSLSNPLDIIWQVPIRVFYFLFSPFPWQIRSAVHVVGFIDSLFYYWMFYQIIKHRKVIFNNKQLLLILTFTFVMIIAFSFGTSNFGTALRHRAKFAPFLMILSFIVFYYNKYRKGIYSL